MFVQKFDHSKISDLHNAIIDASNNLNSVKLDKINNTCHNFIERFSKSAESCINIGIKHDFPFINIRKVPREVLKTEGEARGFQNLQWELANVKE